MNNNDHLFDRSNYNSKTLTIYEIIGAYFTDVYYNYLYNEAVKFKNSGKTKSITEGYRHSTFSFLSCIDFRMKATYKAEKYMQLLKLITEYFILWTNFNTLTTSECIDKIVCEFVPDDYIKQLNKQQKANILRNILIESLAEFTKAINTEYINLIIDSHGSEDTVQVLKERFVDILILQRDGMYRKFLSSEVNKQEKVERVYVDRMKDEIKLLNEKLAKAEQLIRQSEQNVGNEQETIKQLQKEIEIRVDQLQKTIVKYRKMEQNYNEMKSQYEGLISENRQLQSELSRVRSEAVNDFNRMKMMRVQPAREQNPQYDKINESFPTVYESEQELRNEVPKPKVTTAGFERQNNLLDDMSDDEMANINSEILKMETDMNEKKKEAMREEPKKEVKKVMVKEEQKKEQQKDTMREETRKEEQKLTEQRKEAMREDPKKLTEQRKEAVKEQQKEVKKEAVREEPKKELSKDENKKENIKVEAKKPEQKKPVKKPRESDSDDESEDRSKSDKSDKESVIEEPEEITVGRKEKRAADLF